MSVRYPSPDQALPIKLLNRCGSLIKKLGFAGPSLEVETLIRAATDTSGCSDFGDESFRDGLNVLVEALENEARLSLIGRLAARNMILENLVNRLEIVDCRTRNPAISQQSVTAPMIIVGLPRTGTTILHELLAQDPAVRAPLGWEVAKPVPAPSQDTVGTDPRISEVEKSMREMDKLAPEFKAIHEVGALLPQECVSMLASHFLSDQFGASFSIPSYREWCRSHDMTASYQWHFQFLQHLQSEYRPERWVLKTPAHLGYLDALLRQYPDACIVQTHRDPMDVLASVSSLSCTLHSAFSDDVDPYTTGSDEAHHFSDLLRRGMAQRDSLTPAQKAQFFDVQFSDIVSDPISLIESVYEYFGFEFTEDARDAMQTYIANRPRDKHGTHVYSLSDFGLSREKHGVLFDDYVRTYCHEK